MASIIKLLPGSERRVNYYKYVTYVCVYICTYRVIKLAKVTMNIRAVIVFESNNPKFFETLCVGYSPALHWESKLIAIGGLIGHSAA